MSRSKRKQPKSTSKESTEVRRQLMGKFRARSRCALQTGREQPTWKRTSGWVSW